MCSITGMTIQVKIAAVYNKGAKGLLRFEVEDKKKIKLIKKTQKKGIRS